VRAACVSDRNRHEQSTHTAKRSLPKEVQQTLDDIDSVNGAPTWFEADQLRKDIGDALRATQNKTGDISATEKQLQQLYATISQDMEEAVYTWKGPEAAQIWKRAKTHRAAFENRAKILTGLTGAKTPVDAYKAIISMDAPRLRATKRSIFAMPDGQQVWNDVTAAKIWEMGRVTPGTATEQVLDTSVKTADSVMYDIEPFTPLRLAMNYVKMEQSGTSKVWFTGEQRSAMRKLYNVANAQRLLGSADNVSRTAKLSVLQNVLMYGMSFSGVGAVLAGVTGYAYTRPAFVHWMAEGLSKPAALGAAHMGRLVALAKADPTLQPIAEQYLQKWNEMGGSQPIVQARRKSLYESPYLGTQDTQGVFQ